VNRHILPPISPIIQNKYSRGYKMIIDIWGADHHGYMPRLWAGIQALGRIKNP